MMDMGEGKGTNNGTVNNTSTAVKCKIAMTWNWYTIDACFIAKTWQIHTKGHFAGTCIGVFLMVLLLEFVRRVQREYDRKLIRDWQQPQPEIQLANEESKGDKSVALGAGVVRPLTFRPNLLQQAIRAFLYLLQFAGAYFIMLLAMYYNGYVIISIFIGAFFGHYLFGYDNIIITGKQETGTSCC